MQNELCDAVAKDHGVMHVQQHAEACMNSSATIRNQSQPFYCLGQKARCGSAVADEGGNSHLNADSPPAARNGRLVASLNGARL